FTRNCGERLYPAFRHHHPGSGGRDRCAVQSTAQVGAYSGPSPSQARRNSALERLPHRVQIFLIAQLQGLWFELPVVPPDELLAVEDRNFPGKNLLDASEE